MVVAHAAREHLHDDQRVRRRAKQVRCALVQPQPRHFPGRWSGEVLTTTYCASPRPRRPEPRPADLPPSELPSLGNHVAFAPRGDAACRATPTGRCCSAPGGRGRDGVTSEGAVAGGQPAAGRGARAGRRTTSLQVYIEPPELRLQAMAFPVSAGRRLGSAAFNEGATTT